MKIINSFLIVITVMFLLPTVYLDDSPHNKNI